MEATEEVVTINYRLYPEERYAICQECAWFRSSINNARMYVHNELKVHLKSASCPMGNW